MREVWEKYLETIYELKMEKGYVKPVDIAQRLGIKPSSVTEMLQKLARKGFIHYEKYRLVDLTEIGLEIAERLEERHLALKELLLYIGVSEETADRDACEMEHILSTETIEKVKEFMRRRRKKL